MKSKNNLLTGKKELIGISVLAYQNQVLIISAIKNDLLNISHFVTIVVPDISLFLKINCDFRFL